MRHDPGLDASPPVGYILEVERRVPTPFHLPSAVDGQPPRNAAAHGVQRYADTSAPPSKLSTLLKPLICFRVPTRLAKQWMCDSNCRQNRVGQRRNRPRLRGIRLTYAVLSRVTDGARTATFGAIIRRHLFLRVAQSYINNLDKPISLLAVARCFCV